MTSHYLILLIFSLVIFAIIKTVRQHTKTFFVNKPPSIKTFEKQLAITPPWKIDDMSFKTAVNNRQELHVFLSCQKGSIFKDTTGTPCPIHSSYEKTWRHTNFEEQRCYLHCKVPRIKTTEETFQVVDVPWARQNSGFSLSFEKEIIQKLENGESFTTIGTCFGEEANRIWTVFNGWINTAYAADMIDKDLSTIGIDEISDQEKGKQVTITIDLKNERVLHVSQGAGKEALKDVYSYLESKSISPKQIKHVSGPLLNGLHHPASFFENVKTYFPNAEYHIDRLYITKLLNDAMDQIRKKESYHTKKLTLARGLFIKHPSLLSDDQKNEVQKLSAQFPNVGQAYELKNIFFTMWDQSSPQTAETFLESWCQKTSKTKLAPLKRAAAVLKTYKRHIVQFSELPTNSTVMEKIHKNIQTATSRTKGLKNFENVSNMIYLLCGNLPFHDLPMFL